VEDLRRWLAETLPEGPWLYPEDQIADLPLRMIAAEITREKAAPCGCTRNCPIS
jgi:GTPase